MKRLIFAFCLCLALGGKIPPFLYAQNPGMILTSAVPVSNPMDPNGDGWITASGSDLFAFGEDLQFEASWMAYNGYSDEPNGDIKSGSSCGNTDISGDALNSACAFYAMYDAVDAIQNNSNDVLIFRIRTASASLSGSAGYHILLDTDAKFGFTGAAADLNAIAGNPGFEREIIVRKGGSAGVFVTDVDGKTNGTALSSFVIACNYQQSAAYFNSANCSSSAAFQDVMISLSALGINTTTPVRTAVASSLTGNSVLKFTPSDIGGINDNTTSSTDQAWSLIIGSQSAIPAGNISAVPFTLPAGLISFEGTASPTAVTLTWEVASETGNHEFILEQSSNGNEFEAMATVAGMMNDGEAAKYSFTNQNPSQGIKIYRLSMRNSDGFITFLASTEINFSAAGGLETIIYPNPSHGLIHLDINNQSENPCSIVLTNCAGQQIWTGISSHQASQSLSLDLSSFPTGMYILSVENGVENLLKKITIF